MVRKSHTCTGIVPSILVPFNTTCSTLNSNPSSEGIGPVNSLSNKDSCSRLVSLPMLVETGPLNLFSCKLRAPGKEGIIVSKNVHLDAHILLDRYTYEVLLEYIAPQESLPRASLRPL